MSRTATLTESYTEMTEVQLPNDTNNLGRALGGAVLHWTDQSELLQVEHP